MNVINNNNMLQGAAVGSDEFSLKFINQVLKEYYETKYILFGIKITFILNTNRIMTCKIYICVI